MKRKEFFKRAVQMGLGSGSLIWMNRAGGFGQSEEKKSEQETKSLEQKFKEDWIVSLMKRLDEQLDEKTMLRLMESCGRDCAQRSSVRRLAESCKGNVEKLVKNLAGFLGKENNYIEGKVVHLSYSKCYCELVAGGPERLPDTYCHCSRGWVLEIFETASGKPVQVELLQSIKRGAPSCKFLVRL